ncbi:cyclopentanone 1,2-monooxygenase [Annulohypoxylon maeteangense]|uniref:cyclopentanone 1,2-monooxygenase n=1 Tax=Annulohypoxylon maeteangense TaxID=1927788 RepID=UPI002008890B|nr:cyclopentanone 1,2-monooxygenase [Annulohypoxylon maeteangense]KAI0889627.1 cyclopentanone 1,2-monooxygenase [Annulohypoxylon maeteangense]
MGSIEMTNVEELDALIIGAGFSGVYQLKKLRDEGYKAKIVEAGDGYGGIWYWNRYPGARVDSHAPHYQFSDPELWKNWHWKQRFPGHAELREYFDFVAKKWDLRKDTYFNTYITSAHWDETEYKWIIKAKDGRTFKTTFFLPHTGIAASRAVPDWKGISSFKGLIVHSSYWPHDEPELKGKKIATVGTGSTGVQMSHAISKVADELVVFQRTPAMPLRMRQIDYADDEESIPKSEHEDFFKTRSVGYWGFDFNPMPKNTFDDDEASRKATYESLWKEGDFTYWLGNYADTLFSTEANHEVYKFWREKTRARINDPRLKELLAPTEQPYPFGCKRVPLEQGYFEMFNKPNVHLVDVNDTPVVEVTEKGIRTTEKEFDFDVIILATGFDAVTGGLTTIDIRGIGNQSLKEKFSQHGPTTYCGICVSGFPNMFFSYGPQAPTAFCNGPTCAELQGDWIADVMNSLRRAGISSIVADEASEKAWVDHVESVAYASLLPQAKSWYMGDGIPGKPRASQMYLGGVPNYHAKLKSCASSGYKGFRFEGLKV